MEIRIYWNFAEKKAALMSLGGWNTYKDLKLFS
jgi:hypothetical protein